MFVYKFKMYFQQPWCQQILCDLVTAMQFYVASDIVHSKNPTV